MIYKVGNQIFKTQNKYTCKRNFLKNLPEKTFQINTNLAVQYVWQH